MMPALAPGPHPPLPSPASFTPAGLAPAYHRPQLLKAQRNPTGNGGGRAPVESVAKVTPATGQVQSPRRCKGTASGEGRETHVLGP